MKIIFGTTNKRKVEDLQNVANLLKLDIEVLSLSDIGWDRGEIEENGSTIEENSTIKVMSIYDFCSEKGISYPIIADDAGLFCDALGGTPGVYTARYADEELSENPTLPKYECVNKLLRNLSGIENRKAEYRCVVSCVDSDGKVYQTTAKTEGTIATEILGELKKPYFYSVFVADGFNKPFNELNANELSDTYRYVALKQMLKNLYSKSNENIKNM